jgi:sulfate transport system permease protein
VERPSSGPALRDPSVVRLLLIGTTLAFLGLLVAAPLAFIFTRALSRGWETYVTALRDPAARSAIQLTFVVTVLAVLANLAFGLAAAWSIGKFRFRGKSLLVTLLDLPFAVSPVIAGMVFVLLFGMQGWCGPWLAARGIHVVFALPGILLATTFVTFPFVARELIHLMETHGPDDEEAARLMGARGWTLFRRITLPNVRWALFYGVILCTARAMGEFGAVSVVSGHIRGRTNTLPLHVEILYNEYDFAAAFATASLLSLFAVATLVLKTLAEHRAASGRERT